MNVFQNRGLEEEFENQARDADHHESESDTCGDELPIFTQQWPTQIFSSYKTAITARILLSDWHRNNVYIVLRRASIAARFVPTPRRQVTSVGKMLLSNESASTSSPIRLPYSATASGDTSKLIILN